MSVRTCLIRLLVAIFMINFASSGGGNGHFSYDDSFVASARETGLSRYKARKLAGVSPYEKERRWKTYVDLGDVFDRIWRKPSSRKPLKRGISSIFEKYPNLQLEDRDGDGEADFFAFLPSDGSGKTQEFGAFFDLNGDGHTDWIVFYGGILIDKKMKPFIWHHNAIDTNGDGHFDARIFSTIDMDGDGLPDANATAWVYDTDHDGLVDKAENIIDGHVRNIQPDDGVLPLHDILFTAVSEQLKVGEPIPTDLFDAIANDVDGLLRK